MIVYGDPGYAVEFSVLLAQLQGRVASVYALVQDWIREEAANEDIQSAALRSLLIFAGQVEQARRGMLRRNLFLAAEWQGWRSQCKAWTDAAAVAFVATLSLPELQDREAVAASIGRLTTGHLDGGFPLGEEIAAFPVNVKLPEGFRVSTVSIPKRYVESARRWAAEQKPTRGETILIPGVRSIGTSLAALVATALRSQGRQAIRCTVRPTGHPYTRQVDLTAEQLVQARGAAWALIADEGAGECPVPRWLSTAPGACRGRHETGTYHVFARSRRRTGRAGQRNNAPLVGHDAPVCDDVDSHALERFCAVRHSGGANVRFVPRKYACDARGGGWRRAVAANRVRK